MFLTCSYSFLLYSLNLSSYDYNISAMYPVATVKYLKNNADYSNIKLYNDFNFGSFLEFNDIPVFIDSRAEVYIKEFNGGFDIVSDYLDTKKFSTYKSIFEKYKFDYALVYKASEIYYYLKYDTEFEIAFEEENYTLFKKTNSM